jgi:endonuclease YncB( thermonuclease family)
LVKPLGPIKTLFGARNDGKPNPFHAPADLLRVRASFRRAAIACAAMLFQAFLTGGLATAGCGGEEILRGQVQSVLDARTVLLTTAQTVRFAGLELAEGHGEEEATATDTLAAQIETLLARREVILRTADKNVRDRYGRIFAIAQFADTDQTVQAALIERGHALASPLLDDNECFKVLLAAENTARVRNAGLWAGDSATKKAESPAEIAAREGQFVVVEGTVMSVREAGATIYVNFGRRWSRDFTVTIPRRLAKTFQAAETSPQSLENKRIRVRGWVEMRGSAARLRATRPQQIEVLDD